MRPINLLLIFFLRLELCPRIIFWCFSLRNLINLFSLAEYLKNFVCCGWYDIYLLLLRKYCLLKHVSKLDFDFDVDFTEQTSTILITHFKPRNTQKNNTSKLPFTRFPHAISPFLRHSCTNRRYYAFHRDICSKKLSA